MRTHLRATRAGLVVTALALSTQVGLAGVAHAGVRPLYVSPSGTGTGCTISSPCDFQTALGQLVSDGEIVMAPGTYPKTGTYPDPIAPANDSVITGRAGQPSPVINSSASQAVSLGFEDRLSFVQVNDFGAGVTQVVYAANSSTVDHVTAAGGSDIAEGSCILDGAALTDSLCIATGGAAVYAQPADSENTVRNVTAVAASPDGIGLQADENGSGATHITATNSIFLGTKYDVESSATGGGTAEAVLIHCDFADPQVGAGGSINTGTPDTNISAAPKFVDERNADFAEAAGSPTINAGTKTGIAAADTDLAGHPRVLGGQVDIGAYEFLPPKQPELHHFKVVARGRHSIKMKVTVVPRGLPTTLTFVATRAGHRHSVVRQVGASGAKAVTARIRGLTRHRRYTLHVGARSTAGRVRSGSLTAHTK